MKFLKEEVLSKNLSNFFPVSSLKDLNYIRRKCKICGKYFWSKEERDICGDHEQYSFIGKEVSKKRNYLEILEDISLHFEKKGYKAIKRYPVIARWRDDLDFVIASITVFQPWVTDGIIDPPSKKIFIPQFCLRFNDIENVGLTGRHYTGFVMLGQHAFVTPEEYDINQYFMDLYEWFEKNNFPVENFVFHEDTWSGGGNAGTCLEFFYAGLEMANQVYMQYKVIDDEWKELKNLKILDVGIGHERLAWVMGRTLTSYDSVFPNTISFLKENLKVDLDYDLMSKVFSLAANFDFSEKKLEEFINFVKEKIGKNLENEIKALRAVYSIADHLRSLYIAISDGALPSNIGGNYNLRFIARRTFNFLEKYFENIEIEEIIKKISEDWYEKHLVKNIKEISEILEYEKKKYLDIKNKSRKILDKIEVYDAKTLFELYTSYGISPEIVKEYKNIQIPMEFYKYLEEHKKRSKKVEKIESPLIIDSNYPETIKEFYDNWKKYYTSGKLLDIINKNIVVFDKTIFYPEKGGQRSDEGWIFFIDRLKEFNKKIIENIDFPEYVKDLIKDYMIGYNENVLEFEKTYAKVLKCFEQNKIVFHVLDREIDYKGEVLQIINRDIRYKTAKHHTAVHLLTGVLRKFYGNHIWQAGAEKDEFEGRLDVTHYEIPSEEEIERIEQEINKIILEGRKINKYILRRDEAENKYGFTIYQGGFIPEVNLRIVEIEDLDAEACSGTHLDNTSEIGFVKIIGVEKIADGLIRFRIIAGERVIEEYNKFIKIVKNIEKKFRIKVENIDLYIEKLDKDRNKYNKMFLSLLEDYIRSLIKERKLYGKINVEFNEVIKILLKLKNEIDEINLETKDAIISTKEGDKKIDKFYIKFKF
ncbi:MAG: alanine--tRNA ligase-related protein [Nanopusillaceae archaeon]